MRKAFLYLAVGLLACVSSLTADGIHTEYMTISIGSTATNAVVVTNSLAKGWIEDVYVDVPAAGVTGGVWIAYQPMISTMGLVTVYTNAAVTGDIYVRPRVDTTDNAGSALTDDPPVRYSVSGEKLIFRLNPVSNTTGVTWKCYIRMEVPK